MKKLAFFNVKGGVGKSTSVTTVAHIVATMLNKKVLIIDLDPQGNTTDLFLGDDIPEYSVEDILIHPDMDVRKVIYKTEYENLDIIPAVLTLAEAEERLKADIRTPQQFRLKSHLMKLEKEYDYCFLDCSPSISLVNINGLAVTDEVYIPVKCDKWSVMGIDAAQNLMNTVRIYNTALKLGGCFFTQWKGNRNIDKGAYDLLFDKMQNKLLPFKIPVSKLVEECTYASKPLLAYDTGKNRKNVTNVYIELAKFIVCGNKNEFLKNYNQEELKCLNSK